MDDIFEKGTSDRSEAYIFGVFFSIIVLFIFGIVLNMMWTLDPRIASMPEDLETVIMWVMIPVFFFFWGAGSWTVYNGWEDLHVRKFVIVGLVLLDLWAGCLHLYFYLH